METLNVGTHSIEIISDDGSSSANFTVKAAAQPPAPTACTVSFKMNGHGKRIAAQTMKEGEKADRPADPAEKGYTFGGWYADAALSTKFDFNSAINADTTVYAKWTKNSVIPADPNSPKTGDDSHILLWSMLFAVSGAALTGAAVYGRNKRHS